MPAQQLFVNIQNNFFEIVFDIILDVI